LSDITEELPQVEQAQVVHDVEPKLPAAPEATKDSSDQTGLRDTIRAAVKKANEATKEPTAKVPAAPGERERGPDGKFIPKDTKADEAPKQATQPQTNDKPVEQAKPGAEQPKADAAPGTWRADAKAKWDGLDPVVKAEVLKTQSDASREIGRYQQQIKQINDAYTQVEQIIGPRRALWRAQFGNEGEALKRLTDLSDLASQQPEQFLAYYLSQPDIASRIDLQKVFGQNAPPPGSDINSHPVVQRLHQELNGLKQQVTGFIGQQTTQQTATIEQQIHEFASAADGNGAPMRPHFDAVREDVFNLIPALRQQFPNETVPKILDRAYNIAIRTNDSVSAQVAQAEQERIRSDLERQERAKRAALANKSVPPSGPAPGSEAGNANSATDLRATIKRNAAKVWNGADARIN
jgi:hypothetical protein